VGQVGLFDQQRAGRCQDAPGVRLQVLALALGEREDHLLDGLRQRCLLQPFAAQHVVLHRVVEPAGGDLVRAPAPGAYALRDGRDVFHVGPSGLVPLGGVGLAGDGLDLGQGQHLLGHGTTVRRGGGPGSAHRTAR
jgi:hypothetical protein